MPQPTPPVAIFGFNRPELVGSLARQVADARPPVVFLFVDGPRPGNSDDVRACAETRDALDSVAWPCPVERHYQQTNRGLLRAIPDGLSTLFDQVDRAVVLEDDCHPDTSFFPFCGELLERYRDDHRVGMVRGTSVFEAGNASYYFSRFTNIWGWATWADRWKAFDFDMTDWPTARADGWLVELLRDSHAERVMTRRFDEAHSGFGLWDFKWQFACWRRDMAAATPNVNLVSNLGFGAAATTTKVTDSHMAGRAVTPMAFPLVHPEGVAIDREADRREFDWAFPRHRPDRSPIGRVRSFLRRQYTHRSS